MTEDQVYEHIGRLYMEKTAEFQKEAANILSKFKSVGKAVKDKGNSLIDKLVSTHVDGAFNKGLNSPKAMKGADEIVSAFRKSLQRQRKAK